MRKWILALGLMVGAMGSAHAQSNPDILVFLFDDTGAARIGPVARSINVATPSIDSIANGGINYTHAYAAPVCIQARTALLAGQWQQRRSLGNQQGNGPFPPGTLVTLADKLHPEYSPLHQVYPAASRSARTPGARRATILCWPVSTSARAFRTQMKRQRSQCLADQSCGELETVERIGDDQLHILRPRRTTLFPKVDQNVSASKRSSAQLTMSRRPSVMTATANLTATETMLPHSRT